MQLMKVKFLSFSRKTNVNVKGLYVKCTIYIYRNEFDYDKRIQRVLKSLAENSKIQKAINMNILLLC